MLRWLGLVTACLFTPILQAADQPPLKSRPNILLIVADDLGWKDVGWHGGRYQTPHLDELVRTGIELDRHYVQPVCTPTRTALLSGRWTSRFGPHALSPSNRRVFPPGTITLASALKDAGYTTHIAGKWHLGSKPEWGPNHYGFDHSYGSLNGAVDPWTHKYRPGPYLDTWHRDGKVFHEEGNATELVAAEVLKWIHSAKAPWLIYVPFHAIHIPVDAPEIYKQRYAGVHFDDDPERSDAMLRMGAFVSQMDDKVGAFVDALEKTGQRERTLIVFTSDNGGLQRGKNPYVGNVPDSPVLSSNAPLRGFKNQLYEGGVRVPAFVNWPARLKPGKIEESLHAVDWMPTLTHLAGWTPPEGLQLDGMNLWPLLSGETETLPSRPIYIPHPGGRIVLYEGWKLITYNNGRNPQLYHVRSDPSETLNMAESAPEQLHKLLEIEQTLRQADVHEIPADLINEEN